MIKKFQTYLASRRPDVKFGCTVGQLPERTQRIIEGDEVATELATQLSASEVESTGGEFSVATLAGELYTYSPFHNPEGLVEHGLLLIAESSHYRYMYRKGLVSLVDAGGFDAAINMACIDEFEGRNDLVLTQHTLPEFFKMATEKVTRWLDDYDEYLRDQVTKAKTELDAAIKAAQ